MRNQKLERDLSAALYKVEFDCVRCDLSGTIRHIDYLSVQELVH